MINNEIHKVINGIDLSYEEAKDAMGEIMSGNATQVQMTTYLTALRMKGETITEITASAQTMRDMATHMMPPYDVLDIVGTGGDEAGTFNISTTASFVIAAAGIPVAKHGNRSVSSKSGAADVLENLGVNLMIPVEKNQKVLDQTNISFLFAQVHHSSMKNVGPVRKAMGERTVFNILGPLTNPAGATRQLLGVYDEALVEKLAKVLSNLGVKRGLSVCGKDGLDEITLTGPTHCCEIQNGNLTSFDITPEQFGFQTCRPEELQGGTPEENAEITRRILSGVEKGAKRDVVIMNAGLGIYIGKDGITMQEAINQAKEVIDSNQAYKKLNEFIQATQKC